MSRIRLADILEVVRVESETGSHRMPQWHAAVGEIGSSIDAAVQSILSEKTLAQLLDESDAP